MMERHVDAQELIDAVVDYPIDYFNMMDEARNDDDYFLALDISKLNDPYFLSNPEAVVDVIVNNGVVKFKIFRTNWDWEALNKMRERAIKFRENYPFNFSVIMDYNANEVRVKGLQNWNGDKTYFSL